MSRRWHTFERAVAMALVLLAGGQVNFAATGAVQGDARLEEADRLADEAADLSSQRRYGDAAALAERVLASREEALGPDHTDVAASVSVLASYYVLDGDLVNAEPLVERLLEIAGKTGDPHLFDDAGQLLYLMGSTGSSTEPGSLERKERHLLRAEALWARVHGADSPEVLRILSALAMLYGYDTKNVKLRPVLERTLQIVGKAETPDEERLALNVSSLALAYSTDRNDAARAALYERVMAIHEKWYGPDDLRVADDLHEIASSQVSQKDYAKAAELGERALALTEKKLGPDHPDLARKLSLLSDIRQKQHDYARAVALEERILAIREKQLGPNDPSVATVSRNLGGIYFANGEYAKAEEYIARALTIDEQAPDSRAGAIILDLLVLGNVYRVQQDYTKAGPIYERGLAVAEKALPPDSPSVALLMNGLAVVYRDQGDYARAEPLLLRALAIAEKTLGPDSPLNAIALSNLGDLYRLRGDYARAESLALRALATDEKALGPDASAVAIDLSVLGVIYGEQGDYAKAERIFLRALAITEQANGPEALATARVLDSLGALYQSQASYAKAEAMHRRALEIDRKALGPDAPAVAMDLNNLSVVYCARGDFERGVDHLRQALAVEERAFGPDHTMVGTTLVNLAQAYVGQGRFADAESLVIRAVAIQEKALGPEHPRVAVGLNNLALINRWMGKYAKARPLQARAAAIAEKALGANHARLAMMLANLAVLDWIGGDVPSAIASLARASDVRERELVVNLAAGSERQKRAYLEQSAFEQDIAVTLHTRAAASETSALRMALETILRRKGRALDVFTDSIAALRRRSSPKDVKLFDELAAAQAALSSLSTGAVGPDGAGERRREIAVLEQRIEQLENEISSRSAEFRTLTAPVTVDEVRRAIPPDARLVEFVSFWPYDPKANLFVSRRYAVYLLSATGEISWADLGDAREIDRRVAEARASLRDPKSGKVLFVAARVLDEVVMLPVRKLAGSSRRLLVAPDGALNLVPFDALVDENGKYLVESYEISYLTSGRDLLRLRDRIESQQPGAIVANPDFGPARTPSDARGTDGASDGSASSVLASAVFPALGGTEGEARALATAMPGTTVLTGAAATKRAIVGLQAPRLLHVATHGFFLDASPAPARETRALVHESAERKALAPVENPLLRSGLALAGANLHQPDGGGILSALEVSGLNLWGTKLVVLSACDTGLGEVRAGDGVYGLRRALVLAGSETQVMSMWPVSDTGTRDLMIAYYKGLLAGEGRSAAMRAVRLEMLKDPKRAHPFYWASFIVSGEWANLDGKRP